MEEMNIQSYFLIVLGGFGIVWGFRCARYWRKQKAPILDFEYAAFSAILGSLLWFFILPAVVKFNTAIQIVDNFPFMLTPGLFMIGLLIGFVAGFIFQNIDNRSVK